MKKFLLLPLVALGLIAWTPTQAKAGVTFGFSLPVPVPAPAPAYPYPYYYGYPTPYYGYSYSYGYYPGYAYSVTVTCSTSVREGENVVKGLHDSWRGGAGTNPEPGHTGSGVGNTRRA